MLRFWFFHHGGRCGLSAHGAQEGTGGQHPPRLDLAAAVPDPDAPAAAVADDAAAAKAALRSALARGRPLPPPRPPAWKPAPPPRAPADRAAAGTAQRAADFADGVDVPAGVTVTDVALEVGPGVWMPTTLALPARATPAARAPALVWLHATGSSRAAMRARLLAAAAAGFVGIAPDARWHGDRCGGGRREYEEALVAAWRAAGSGGGGEGGGGAGGRGAPSPPATTIPPRPFLLDTVWDLTRLMDWIAAGQGEGGGADAGPTTPPNPASRIDASRVGVSGVSLGGMHAWLWSVADDRVAAAAPGIGVQSFAWAAAAEEGGGLGSGSAGAWKARAASIPAVFAAAAEDRGLSEPDAATFAVVLDTIAPGLRTAFDAPRSLAAISPRPLLVINGEADGRCPVPGVELAVARARRVYEQDGAPAGALTLSVHGGVGHEMTAAMDGEALAWMVRWLKGGRG